MKKIAIVSLCLFILSVTLKSQDAPGKSTSSGKITYEEKAKLEFKLQGDAAQFADNLPKEQITSKVLLFSPEYSLYMNDNAAKKEDIMNQQSGAVQVKVFNGGQNDKVFCDIKKNEKTEQKEFMTRQFIVEDKTVSSDWKITGNFLSILGYNCQEAMYHDSLKTVKAWFTNLIPVSTGPAGFNGLPGLILKVDINDGKKVITASAIDPSWNDMAMLVKPKEGKKVSSVEFRKIVDDKMKEMGSENSDGANHVVIKYRN